MRDCDRCIHFVCGTCESWVCEYKDRAKVMERLKRPEGKRQMFRTDCINWDGDGDCNKCTKYGYIFSCPELCDGFENHIEKSSGMKNWEKFKEVFKIYPSELWSMPKEEFWKWLDTEYKEKEIEENG